MANRVFTDQFLGNLPDDIAKAGLAMCRELTEILDKFSEEEIDRLYPDLNEALGIYVFVLGELGISIAQDADLTLEWLYKSRETIGNTFLGRGRKIGEALLSTQRRYEFDDADFDRIQTLINELRELITASEVIDEDHKSRLLKRLEKLQQELHKKMSNVDMLWGLIGDAGVVLGKFGHDVKPLTDRIREIVEIVWRVQAAAAGLPSGLPLRLPGETEPEGD